MSFFLLQEKYIPWNMCTILFCYILVWLTLTNCGDIIFLLINLFCIYWSISFTAALLALGQLQDCCEVTLNDMGKISWYQSTIKLNKVQTMYIILEMCCIWWLTSACQSDEVLTHWGRDKMAAISQTTFSNAFSLMKIYGFRLKFHWGLFLRFELTIFQHWFR